MVILAVGRGSHVDLATSPTSGRVPTPPEDRQVRLCPTPSSLRVTSPSGRNSQAKNGVNKTGVSACAAFHDRQHGREQLFRGNNRCNWAGFRSEGALSSDAAYHALLQSV
jgi:hypothetical protein